jgi:enoyl-CoA hydratase/carnithine racemase
MTKQLLTENLAEADLWAAQQREMRMLSECWTTPEHKEAVAAFLAKRPPVFRPEA